MRRLAVALSLSWGASHATTHGHLQQQRHNPPPSDRRRRLGAIPSARFAADLMGSIQDLTFMLPVAVGTPPTTVNLRLDTGSSVSFIPTPDVCSSCGAPGSMVVVPSSGNGEEWRPFNCSASGTCVPVSCEDERCTGSACAASCVGVSGLVGGDCASTSTASLAADAPCCAAATPSSCGFTASYADGSVVAGALAVDMATTAGGLLVLDELQFGSFCVMRVGVVGW
jgi:hypothetical protein